MSLSQFLARLPADKLGRLYASPWACIAVFRTLPALAKQYVLRLLYVDGLSDDMVGGWVAREGAGKHKAALERLSRLHILDAATGDKAHAYRLAAVFRENMQFALSGRLAATMDHPPADVVGAMPGYAQLEAYAQERWEAVLLFLSAGATLPMAFYERDIIPEGFPLLDVKGLFRSAGLLATPQAKEGAKAGVSGAGTKRKKEAATDVITEEGFQYLLQDTSAQLWVLIRQYIRSMEKEGVDPTEVVGLLLKAVAVDMSSDGERCVVSHLAKLGLLCLLQPGAGGARRGGGGGVGVGTWWFCPTPLAACLCRGENDTRGVSGAVEGNVICETNYRVYAYTQSELQLSILRMFLRSEYRIANLYVGSITRESVGRAMEAGITADQIVGYLSQHAHPHVAKRTPIVPEAVSDQVRLWESDTRRVAQTEAVMYEAFESEGLFKAVCEFARGRGALLWEAAADRRMVCGAGHYNEIRDFIKSEKGKH